MIIKLVSVNIQSRYTYNFICKSVEIQVESRFFVVEDTETEVI